MTVRAAGYVRVSTQEQQEHGYNLAEDKRLIAELCEQRDWQLVEIYDDGGRQGDDPDRPGLLRMLAELERFDVLVIRSQERLSRDPVIWATTAAALQKAKVRLETFHGPIDLETPQGEFVAGHDGAGRPAREGAGRPARQAGAWGWAPAG